MNKLEPTEVRVGTVYWLEIYLGHERCSTELVKVLSAELKGRECFKAYTFKVLALMSGEELEVSGSYMNFQEVHPKFIENSIASKRTELLRITREIEILESIL